MHGWDLILTFLVVALAFLSASFVARNSDLWFHLATGRLVAQGEFPFGADPFAYTTRNVYWACHSWLFDLGLYELYQVIGGTGLVVLKALFVAGLAGLMVRVRRPGCGIWAPVVCTTLAIVAMSPRLLLQPACVSYGFLGLTFWLLWFLGQNTLRQRATQTPKSALAPGLLLSRYPHVVLPLVFALWVNIDEWFLLGPALTMLFWVGERLQGEKRTPGWVVLAGLAACLVNPYTFHAFTLPAELSALVGTDGVRGDARFQAIFASPWSLSNLQTTVLIPATLAYFALTYFGLAGFLVNRRALLGWRLVVWLPFAALAAWQARAIPFFVVVAAPITALNWQDYLAGLAGAATSGGRSVLPSPSLRATARLIVLLGLAGLIFLTWSGWQVGGGREERRVAWGFQADPSLQHVAETLHDWRRRQLLTAGERVFAVAPEAAQYGAWFSPGEEHFLDHRFQLFSGTSQDYEIVCQALLPGLNHPRPARDGMEGEKDWRQVLRGRAVSVVIFSDRDPQRLFAILNRLANDSKHWTLLDISGQALIFGWNEARPGGDFSSLAFDADWLAFGPQDERARHRLSAAPDDGPEHLPLPRDFWARLARSPAPPSWESAAATMFLHYADDTDTARRQREMQLSLCCFAGSLAGLPALPSGVPLAAFQLASSRNLLFSRGDTDVFLVRDQLGPYFAHLVERSPGLALLAVRAARRAVAVNPEDSNAWLGLGEAYLQLRTLTCERSTEGMLPPLAQLRHVQIATALEQAVRLDPDLEAAHHELAHLYGERNYLDEALSHQKEELRLSRRAGSHSNETAEERADRLELLEKDTAKLVELVQERRKVFSSNSRTLQGGRLAQADLALKLGLARQALDEILLPSPADLLGSAGMKMELDLLLTLGRVEEVRTILSDESLQTSKQGLKYYDLPPPRTGDGAPLYASPYHLPAYEWLHVLQTAAVGDYAKARGDLRAMRSGLSAAHERLKQDLRDFDRHMWTYLPGLLSSPPPFLPAFSAQAAARFFDSKTRLEADEPTFRAQQGDLFVLEGLLDLEQGDTDAARSAFSQAERLCGEPPNSAVTFGGTPIAAYYLGKLKAQD